jgi:hypothetical protein
MIQPLLKGGGFLFYRKKTELQGRGVQNIESILLVGTSQSVLLNFAECAVKTPQGRNAAFCMHRGFREFIFNSEVYMRKTRWD